MSPITSHPFFGLDESERVRWIASFLDNPAADAPYGVAFPVLRAEEQPFSWLTDQFRRIQKVKDLPDRVRRPVVNLILTQAGRGLIRNRPQVLGELLEVVGACGFTDKEIVDTLRGWLQADLYEDAWYQVFGNAMSVRGRIWSLLIGWRQTDGMIDALRRDFPRSYLNCMQICFAELGRLSPGDAIERIPATFSWPEPYWREVLRRFFNSLGARQATAERYKPAWERCFAEIFWDRSKFILVEAPLGGLFAQLLREVGIHFRYSGTVIHLWPIELGAPGLEIDVATYRFAASEELVASINRELVEAGY
jgi:hypothetical protein